MYVLHRKSNWKPVAKAAPATDPANTRGDTPPAKKHTKTEKAAFKAEKKAESEKAEAKAAKKQAASAKKRAAGKAGKANVAVLADGMFCWSCRAVLRKTQCYPSEGVKRTWDVE